MKDFLKRIIRKYQYISFQIRQKYLTTYLKSRKPVFIVGCPHSGTTIMLSILSEHPSFYTLFNETYLFHKHIIDLEKWYAIIKKAGSKRLLEKTPVHVKEIKRILEIFPSAKIVIMIRDGRDVACSMKERFGNIEIGIKDWVDYNEAWIPFKDIKNIYPIQLESFLANKEQYITKLLFYLDLPYCDTLFEYHKESKIFFTDFNPEDVMQKTQFERRNRQVNQPLFSNTSRWEKEMIESEKQLFKQKANYLLQYFGYTENDTW